MDNKILEILIQMQSELKEVNNQIKCIDNKIDRIEFKMNDGFETLELLCENNATELNKLKIKVAKLEKRMFEMNATH